MPEKMISVWEKKVCSVYNYNCLIVCIVPMYHGIKNKRYSPKINRMKFVGFVTLELHLSMQNGKAHQ